MNFVPLIIAGVVAIVVMSIFIPLIVFINK